MQQHRQSFWQQRYDAIRTFCFRSKSSPEAHPTGQEGEEGESCSRVPVVFSIPLLTTGVLLFLYAALPGHPIETLSLERKQGKEIRMVLPLGYTMTTRYLHSVEKTPVEDIYYALGRRLYQWRTRTRSHNAGLPWQAPETGRFLMEDGWMILEGGRHSWDEVLLRVGSAQFGRNEILIGNELWKSLYKEFPGESLRFSAIRSPLVSPLFL